MEFDIYNPHANKNVTADYVEIIRKSLEMAGHSTREIDKPIKSKANLQRGIVCIQASTTRLAKRCKYGKIIRWVQGAGEAESYMRHHSKLRYLVLSALNYYAFCCCDFVIFCSQTMKTYYEKRFHKSFKHSYIMPCFNDEIKKEVYFTDGKYADNIFTYAGSLDVWQCFEPTVALYREVEKQTDNTLFRVLTKDKEAAENILKKYGVQRYSIGFVPKEQVADEMAKAKFGFCIREDSIVNRVATPTKLSSYVANGVMPIYSEYIEDFHNLAKNSKYCFCANPEFDSQVVEKLVAACNKDISANDVFSEYTEIFGNYYSKAFHAEMLTELLK
ncbi:MAG: hypothetical protein IKV97_00130 [Clostridia bacterium]|nr:hypothetical protein [Clostridia bacterium]